MITTEFKVTFEFSVAVWNKFEGTSKYLSLLHTAVRGHIECGRGFHPDSTLEWATFNTVQQAIDAEHALSIMAEGFELELKALQCAPVESISPSFAPLQNMNNGFLTLYSSK
jgi:hypothetical protein